MALPFMIMGAHSCMLLFGGLHTERVLTPTPRLCFVGRFPGFYVAPEGWSCSACLAAKQQCPPSHADPLLFMAVQKDHYYDQDQFLPHVCV